MQQVATDAFGNALGQSLATAAGPDSTELMVAAATKSLTSALNFGVGGSAMFGPPGNVGALGRGIDVTPHSASNAANDTPESDGIQVVDTDPSGDDRIDPGLRSQAYDTLYKTTGSADLAEKYATRFAQITSDSFDNLNFGPATGNPNAKYQVRPQDAEQARAYDKVLALGKSAQDAWEVGNVVAIRQRVDAMSDRISNLESVSIDAASALRDEQRVLTLALIDRDTYFDRSIPEVLPKGWARVTDAQGLAAVNLRQSELSREDGYFGALYKNASDGGYVFANRGTDDRNDWVDNFLQSVGERSPQYDFAMDVAGRFKIRGIDNVTFTGHSLGGGLASAQAIVAGKSAVTFNAAGLNAATVARFGGDIEKAEKLVTAYYVKGEVLSGLQDADASSRFTVAPVLGPPMIIASALAPLPRAAGTRVELDPVSSPSMQRGALVAGKTYSINSIGDAIQAHSMTSVLNSMWSRADRIR